MVVTGVTAGLSVILGLVLLALAWLVGGRFLSSRAKSDPFECGFDPKDSARIPFSMRFFLLVVLFLVFDIEVVLLFPLVLLLATSAAWMTLVSSLGFLVILLGGLFYEWSQGSLAWVI